MWLRPGSPSLKFVGVASMRTSASIRVNASIPDIPGRQRTHLDATYLGSGGDRGTRTPTGVSPSDFKSDGGCGVCVREGRFRGGLRAVCVQFARGVHPRCACRTREFSESAPGEGCSAKEVGRVLGHYGLEFQGFRFGRVFGYYALNRDAVLSTTRKSTLMIPILIKVARSCRRLPNRYPALSIIERDPSLEFLDL